MLEVDPRERPDIHRGLLQYASEPAPPVLALLIVLEFAALANIRLILRSRTPSALSLA
jgi:hypothetical protein